jgi:hypothetical protein
MELMEGLLLVWRVEEGRVMRGLVSLCQVIGRTASEKEH